jgi:exopolysaccharide biosynthesis protein
MTTNRKPLSLHWLTLFACLLAHPAAAEISATNEVLPGVFIHAETRTNPPQQFFVAVVDLKNPRLHLRVSRGGADPDGDGKWQTTLMEPTKIAAREKFDFVINGDFFIARGVNDGEGTNAMFRAAQWALTEGAAMTDGVTWSTSTNVRPCLVVHKNGAVTFDSITQPVGDDWQVVGGNTMLVREGKIIPHKNLARHPRTVAGLNATHDRLTLLLVDGRKPGVAVGMSYDELAAEMVRLGCTEALNLDGGGSSVMAVRENSKLKILNQPTDGRERAVADVLGICVDKN